jgi:hypothetical protein
MRFNSACSIHSLLVEPGVIMLEVLCLDKLVTLSAFGYHL